MQAGPRCPGMPRAPTLTSWVLWGNTSLPPLKTFAGAAQFGETLPELLADGVLGCWDSSAGGSFAMFPPMSAKDSFGPGRLCGSLARRCLPFHRVARALGALCLSFPPVRLPELRLGGGVPLEIGVCKRRSESVLGVSVRRCVMSAKGARGIAKHLLSGTESFFLLYIFPPLFWHALQLQQFIVGTRASGGPALTEIRCLFPINLGKKKNIYIHKG